MQKSQLVARRAAALTAGAALAASALVAGAGSAQADTAADLTGTVTTAAGTPIPGIEVNAYKLAADGTIDSIVDDATTDAAGRYTFTDLETAGTTVVKLGFFDGNDYGRNVRALTWRSTFFGGAQTARASALVSFVPGAATPVANQTLERNAGLAVRVLNPGGVPVNDEAFATLFDARANLGFEFGALASGDSTDDDALYNDPATPATEPAPKDGVVYFNFLEADRALKVLGGGNDVDAAGKETFYLGQFLGGGYAFDKATVVTPKEGAFQDVTVTLSNTFKPTQKPRIVGNTSVGKTLTADPGIWPAQAATEFGYQWLRGSEVVSTLKNYTLTKADKKKKIRLVITATDGDFISQVSVTSAKVGEKAKVKARKVNGGEQVLATVKVAQKGKAKKVGKIKGKVVAYDENGAQVSNKAKVRGGTALLKLRNSAEGKLTITYLGGGKLGTDSATVKLGGGKGGKKK